MFHERKSLKQDKGTQEARERLTKETKNHIKLTTLH